jgi:hypothetical protein
VQREGGSRECGGGLGRVRRHRLIPVELEHSR